MLSSVFTKSLRDRWVSMTVASVVLGLYLVVAMATYQDVDLSIYDDLPDGVRQLFGFGEGAADAGQLAYGAVYSFIAALTLAGVAISIGSSAIAGEERDGTMSVLLASPKSRARVLSQKTAGLIVLTLAGAVVLWGAALLAPELLAVGTAGLEIDALMIHMFFNALFFGLLALAIGSWAGSTTTASGVAAAVMVISYLAVSVLPLLGGLSDLARIFPWYYYNGSDPLKNGVDLAHLAVLIGCSSLFVAASIVGFRRRDVRERTVGTSLVDRLRGNRLTHRAMDRLAGSARVSSILAKTASEHQGMLVVTGLIVFLLGVWIGPMYGQIDQSLKTITEDLPEGVMALIGNADMSTPEGWLTGEMFSFIVPVAFIAVGVVIGSRALAGEERQGTMGLLLACPVSRERIVLDKAGALVVHVGLLGLLTFLGVTLGSWLGDLGVGAAEIAAATLLGTLLGIVFGVFALALSAATGRVPISAYGAAGAALIAYLANSMLPLTDGLADFARLSPFYYYLTSDPVSNGMEWGHAAVLAGLAAGLTALSVVLFQRRDLR